MCMEIHSTTKLRLIFLEIKRRKGWPSRLRAQSLSTIGEGVERKSLAMGSAAA